MAYAFVSSKASLVEQEIVPQTTDILATSPEAWAVRALRHPAAQRSQEADIKIPNQTCRGTHGSVLSGQSHQAESDSTRYTYLLIGRESRLANGRCVLTAFAVQLERCVTDNDTLAVLSH